MPLEEKLKDYFLRHPKGLLWTMPQITSRRGYWNESLERLAIFTINIMRLRGEYEKAVMYHDNLPFVNSSVAEARRLTSLGRVYHDKGELNIALTAYDKAHRVLSKDDELSRARLYSNVGQLFTDEGDKLNQARQLLNESLEIYIDMEGNKAIRGEALVYLRLGNLDYKVADKGYAAEKYKQAIETFVKAGDTPGIVLAMYEQNKLLDVRDRNEPLLKAQQLLRPYKNTYSVLAERIILKIKENTRDEL